MTVIPSPPRRVRGGTFRPYIAQVFQHWRSKQTRERFSDIDRFTLHHNPGWHWRGVLQWVQKDQNEEAKR